MSPENLIGICDESTTYRDDFRGLRATKIERDDLRDRKNPRTKIATPVFAESHDTFQKFGYDSRLTFDALWRPKDIVGTDPRDSVCRKRQPEENENLLARPVELVSPAVRLDDVKDAETRKLIANYLYQSSVARAAKEVWRNFEATREKHAHETISEESGHSMPRKTNRVPPHLENGAKKWDSLQDRRLINRTNIEKKIGPFCSAETSTNSCEKLDHDRAIRELIKDGKSIRLPYEKLSLSYGGHRTSIALGVPVLKKKVSPYHPDLTVSQVLVS